MNDDTIQKTDQESAPIHHQDIHRLTFRDKEITLIATAHVSQESADLVKRVIEEEKPETVCVELCAPRYQALIQKNRWENMDIFKVIKEKKAFLLLSNLLLNSFQRKIGEKLGVRPGEEVLQAIQAANEAGSEIYLADREIRITLSRTWRLMGLWSKSKMLFQFLISLGDIEEITPEDVEKLKREDMLETVLSEIGKSFPEIRKILIDERDQYLAEKIRTAPGKKIVAAVGAGHVPGILKYWNEEVDLKALEQMPPPGRITGFLKWAIPLGIIGFIIFAFFTAGSKAGTDMIKSWVLANSVFAGLGAIASLAHPLTILTAMVAAPFTSGNPMMAAGWVAGLVEAFIKKPRVKDFEILPDDIMSLKGFWKNRVTQILLVVALTNLGSVIGTFVAIPLMARVFT